MSSTISSDSITDRREVEQDVDAILAQLTALDDEQLRAVRRGLIYGRRGSGKTSLLGRAEEQRRATLASLVEALTPDIGIPSEAAVVLSRRNAKRRAELLEEFGAFTSEQVAEGRSTARNRHALATRWRKEGKIFGVPYRGQTVFPAFQFHDDGSVRPAIQATLSALPTSDMTPWEVGFWWTSANGWLRDQRPVDLLDGSVETLVEAANHLAEPPPL